MDIKSKKSARLGLQELLVYCLVLVLFTSFVMIALDIFESSSDKSYMPVFLPVDDYLYSQDFIFKTSNTVLTLKDYIFKYKNEENIRAGNTLKYKDTNYDQDLEILFNNYVDEINYYLMDNSYINDQDPKDQLSRLEMKKRFDQDKKEEIQALKKEAIDMELANFENIKRRLRNINPDELVFYATNGSEKISNTDSRKKEDFKALPVYVIVDRDGIEVGNERAYESVYSFIAEENSKDIVEGPKYENNKYRIYLGYRYDFINEMLNKWNQSRKEVEIQVQKLVLVGFLFLIAFIRLVFITGKDKESNQVQLRGIDRIYTDINVILCFLIILTWFMVVGALINYRPNISILASKPLYLVTLVCGGLGLSLVLSLIRHIKDGSLLSYSLVGLVFKKFFDIVANIYHSGSTSKKIIAIIIIYPLLLGLTIFMLPVTIGLTIWLALKKVNRFEEIRAGVKKIKDGDLDYKIQIDKDGDFKELADDINDIGQGLKNAVDNELVSERHRSELITNVSHDIRTPLTSIITYVDLLKVETDPEKSKEYIRILDQKSERLKKLIDDLFEASKVNSGSIPVELEKINLVSLITQGIGELDDRIQETKMDFIISTSSDEIYVKADGNLLWRAIENLLSNIFKYGLENSRVYVDIIEDEDSVLFIMKNISAYKLNISEKELMERFKRGDDSRSSEGSGLGLSIAESLIKLQKGKFFIEIDGDLFKTTMILQKY